jgi:transcriptional regulator with XRE-family HTH domain
MDTCYKCESKLEIVKDQPYHYTESGLDNVWLIGILQYKCKKCVEVFIEIPKINDLHLIIGKNLVCQKDLLRGSEVRFLRKEIGMKGKDMAAALSMEPETYSRWENGKQDIASCPDKTLRMIYVMSASEKTGKILFSDSRFILNNIAITKAPKKSKKIQFSPVEWLNRSDEPIFGSACL